MSDRPVTDGGLGQPGGEQDQNGKSSQTRKASDAGIDQGPGELLAAGRKARELSIDEVGDALNLAPQTVEWLEADNFEALPAAAFTQGYIRNFAKLVELDPDLVVQAYQAKAGKPDLAWEATGGGAGLGELVQRHLGLLITALVSAVVLLIIIVLAIVWPEDEEPTASDELAIGAELAPNAGATARGGGQDASATRNVPLQQRNAQLQQAEANSVAASAASNGSAFAGASGAGASDGPRSQRFDAPASNIDREAIDPNDPLAHLPVAETFPVSPGTQDSTAVASSGAASQSSTGALQGDYRLAVSQRLTPTGSDELRFDVIEDCWIAVKTPAGEELFGRLGRPGQTITLTGEGPFRVVLGYAPGARLYLDNQEIGLESYTRNNVASLVIGQ